MNRTDKRIAVFMGQKLRAHRRANDISVDKLADRIGIDKATLSRYEKGKINVPYTRYMRWCRALKVDGGKLHNETVKHIFRKRG